MGKKSSKKHTSDAAKTQKSQQIHHDSTFKNIIFAALAILIAYPPFFRGLFFDKELLPTQIGVFILFIIFALWKHQAGEHIYLQNPLDISLAILVMVYVISIFAAVNLRLAIGEALKYFMFFAIFLMAKDFGREMPYNNIIMDVILLSGLGVALVGIASAIGTVKYNGAFVQNMINSTLQYHNAFGAFMLCAAFICFSRMSSVAMKFKPTYHVINFALFFGYIFSFSRGAWVLFPPLAVIYLALNSPQARIEFLSSLAGILAGLAVSGRGFYHIVTTNPGNAAWGYFFIGLLTSVVATAVVYWMLKLLLADKKREIIGIASLCIIILAATIIFKDKIIHLIPKDLLERFSQINLETQTASERFVFYRDAFKIIKEHPVFGIGGGGWSCVYFMYQSYLYWTTQTHNYIFQVWIEAGTIGLLALIAVILSFIYVFIKAYRAQIDKPSRAAVSGIAVSGLALLSHSFIDFDLSLASLSIFLWALMGLLASFYQPLDINVAAIKTGIKRFQIKLQYPLIPVCYILLTLLCTSLYNGYLYGQKAVAAVQAKDMESAKEYFKSAAKFDPFMSSYKADLASVMSTLGEQQKSKSMLDESVQYVKVAVELDPYNSKILASAAKIFLNQGRINEGLEYINKSIKVQPLNPSNYQQKAQAYMAVADYYLRQKDLDNAKQLLSEVVKIPSDIEEINKKIMKPVGLSDETKKVIQQAEDLLKALQ